MRKESNFLAYVFLLLTVTFWAGNFIIGKFASLYNVPPFSLNFYRWFFAWLILAPFTLPEIIRNKDYIIKNYKLFEEKKSFIKNLFSSRSGSNDLIDRFIQSVKENSFWSRYGL